MLELELLQRAGCHLCDEADELLFQISIDVPIGVIKVDVDQNQALLERYGDRVPVVRFPSGNALEAPLTEARLRAAIDAERGAKSADVRGKRRRR